jgi:hypothetical protein
MLRFCAKPGAPSVTSVSPGGTSGAATVDVVAAAGADNGCAADKYEFRTSTTGEWVSAPALNFSIFYDLTSGQSVCVQMRGHNEAGWGPASASTCGNARNSAADAAAAGGGGGGGVVVTDVNHTVTPTSITVGLGQSFTVSNTINYMSIDVWPTGGLPAQISLNGVPCTSVAKCSVAASSSAVFSVVRDGEITVESTPVDIVAPPG